MAKGKQAKILSEIQFQKCLEETSKGRNPKRDKVIFLLSTKAGLRAKEISKVTWGMLTDAEGEISTHIELEDIASKGQSGRSIPINKLLKAALIDLKGSCPKDADDCVIHSERGDRMRTSSIVNWFASLYERLGYDGCSSHSGRRTFITNAAKKLSLVGASLRDVQQLAGHSNLNTTQRYIEGDSEAKRKLIDLI